MSTNFSTLRLQRPTLVRITLCRWGIFIGLLAHLLLFSAELVHFWVEPTTLGSMKLFGYGALFAIILTKVIKAHRAGKLFAPRHPDEGDEL